MKPSPTPPVYVLAAPVICAILCVVAGYALVGTYGYPGCFNLAVFSYLIIVLIIWAICQTLLYREEYPAERFGVRDLLIGPQRGSIRSKRALGRVLTPALAIVYVLCLELVSIEGFPSLEVAASPFVVVIVITAAALSYISMIGFWQIYLNRRDQEEQDS